MNSTYLTLVIIASTILFAIILYSLPVGLYLSAKFAGVDINLFELIAIKMRKAPVTDVVNSKIRLHKIGMYTNINNLEKHYHEGGNLDNVVNGIIYAKRNGLNLTFEKACKADLNDIDLVELAKNKKQI
jgi:uncharacterized protein YqfA (UPF0365 family)